MTAADYMNMPHDELWTYFATEKSNIVVKSDGNICFIKKEELGKYADMTVKEFVRLLINKCDKKGKGNGEGNDCNLHISFVSEDVPKEDLSVFNC